MLYLRIWIVLIKIYLLLLLMTARDPGSTPARGNIFRNKFITIF